GRGGVKEDDVSTKLISPVVLIDQAADATQPLSFPAPGEGDLELADQGVLKIGEDAAGFQQALVRLENVPHQGNRKVIQRQARHQKVVNAFTRHFLEGRMDQADLVPAATK